VTEAVAPLAPDPHATSSNDLDAFVAAVQRTCLCDALVVGVRSGPHLLSLAAAIGISDEEQRPLRTAITHLCGSIDDTTEVHIPCLADSDRPGTAELHALGYRALVAADLHLDGASLGVLVVLRTSEGEIDNVELVGPFARQTALVIAHRRVPRQAAALVERLENLEALDQVALSSNDFDQLNAALRQCVAPILGATMTGVMVWDEHREVLQLTPGSFGADAGTTASYQITAFDLHSNAARVFSTGRPYLSNDAQDDTGILRDYVVAFGIRRLLSLQLSVAGRPIGVLHLANKHDEFRFEDLRRAERLAPRIATVVELARAMFELRRREQIEVVLSWVAVAIASGQSLLEFLPRALEEMCAPLQAAMLAIAPEGSEAIVHRLSDERADLADTVLREAQKGPGVRAYVVGPQKAGDPGWAAYYRPIHLGRQRIGTLAALRHRGEPFSQSERVALARVGNLAALGWASERYQQQRAELARLQERQRIADDLHDDVAQILFGAHLGLDGILESRSLDPAVAEGIAHARGLLIRGDTAIRSVIHQLSQPINSDLPSRLTDVVSSVENEFSIPVHLELTDPGAEAAKRLTRTAGDALLKVAREALVNAAKHAGPCRASVRLDLGRTGAVRLRVIDDGIGTTGSARRGHGLASLRRSLETHGGRLRVRRGSAGGTTVTASLPL
jgi:signal transduction histidine kinase